MSVLSVLRDVFAVWGFLSFLACLTLVMMVRSVARRQETEHAALEAEAAELYREGR